MTLESQSLNLNARQILIKRLNSVQAEAYTGPMGELIIDTTLKLLRIQDGVTPGGILITSQANLTATINSVRANLQSQISSILDNSNSALDSLQELVADYTQLIANNSESQLINSGFYANLTSTGTLVVPGDILPKTGLAQDLGSINQPWNNLFIGSNTIYFGNVPMSVTNDGLQIGTVTDRRPIFGNIRFPDGTLQTSAVNQATVANIYALLTPNVAANLTAIHADVTNAISYFDSIVEAEVNDIRANLAALAKTWTNPVTANVWSTNEYHGGVRVTNQGFDTGLSLTLQTGQSSFDMAEYDAGDDSIPVIRVNRYEYPAFGQLQMGFVGETVVNANVTIDGNSFEVSAIDLEGDYYLFTLNQSIPSYANNQSFSFEYDTSAIGVPVLWFDPSNAASGIANFRGAVIDYHAFSDDSGTMIGTIHIASNSGQTNVTHTETGSGTDTLINNILWGRFAGNEPKLFYYRADGIAMPISIHWTAKIFYSADYLG